MRIIDIIEKKKKGEVLTPQEIAFFVQGYTKGDIPDYQISALLMAICIKGMDAEETAQLTKYMTESGDVVDLSSVDGIKVDKHSTGGVGDKTTLVVAPIVAACGVKVAKMSGKGLGHTGGTIDKLEAIPGFTTSLKLDTFIDNVNHAGLAVAGQTGNLVPADKKLYALRDVTATVDNISLISSSIMSKKLASGADVIVLDVKVGSGAFMKNIEDAKELAKEMVSIGDKMGRKTAALLTNMDSPLGNAVGNSIEVIEAIETLKGNGPNDFHELCITISGKILELSGMGCYDECINLAEDTISNGSALKKLEKMIELQSGDVKVINDYTIMKQAQYENVFIAEADGYITNMDTYKIGNAAMVSGAGRETKKSEIDYSAGLVFKKKTGDIVVKGDVVCKIYTNKANLIDNIKSLLKQAITIDKKEPVKQPLIYEVVD